MKITITKEVRDHVQELAVKTEARKDLISWMVDKGVDITSEKFKAIMSEYEEYFLEYEKAKSEVEAQFVKPACPNAKNWNLDFNTLELEIEE